MDCKPDLTTTLAEHLATYAEMVDRLGTDVPEQTAGEHHELIGRLIQQRARVEAALAGDNPAAVERHTASLTKGLRLVMRRYGASSC